MSKKETDIEYKNMDTEDEMVQKILKHRAEILENFSKAYMIDANVKPSELELVEQTRVDDGKIKEIVYFFRRKKSEDDLSTT